MEFKNTTQIEQYLRNQLNQAEIRLRSKVINELTGLPYPRRNITYKVASYIDSYMRTLQGLRWIILAGLRGVGKTTIIAQLYTSLDVPNIHKLYLSMDEVKLVLGPKTSLLDILSVYEGILGSLFENLNTPVYLFIDEIHNEENWAIELKTIYERSNKVYIICTGSSALSLQTSADTSRRSYFEKVLPMSFTEYMLLKYNKPIPETIGEEIRTILFNATDAREVYERLLTLHASVNQYWVLDRLELDKYMKYGTLPVALDNENEVLIYSQIRKSLDNIENTDIRRIGKFDERTVRVLDQILYVITSNDTTSMHTLSKNFSINIQTLADIFDIFTKSELLLKVLPYGSHMGQIKKPSKYLFSSPAYRSMFFNLIGSTISYDQYKGKILEDVVGLYLYRILSGQGEASLTYDLYQNSADFVTIPVSGKKVAIEVGYSEKGFVQTENTIQRIQGTYGLVLSPSRLLLNDNKTVVSVPLNYFLLI